MLLRVIVVEVVRGFVLGGLLASSHSEITIWLLFITLISLTENRLDALEDAEEVFCARRRLRFLSNIRISW